jgi:hypothetical protein
VARLDDRRLRGDDRDCRAVFMFIMDPRERLYDLPDHALIDVFLARVGG